MKYEVNISLDLITINVTAKNITEAKQKALKRLERRNPTKLIATHYLTSRKIIDVEERFYQP